MRMKTRVAIIVMILFSLSLSSVYAADLGNFTNVKQYNDFNDVTSSAWYYQDVKKAYETGLFVGRNETSFSPEGNLTLAEAITLVARVHHIYNGGDGSVSEEVTPDWYGKYVNYAVDNNLFLAGEFTNFNRNATRAELAYLFYNSLDSADFKAVNSITKLPDVSNSTNYYTEIYALYNAGILRGSDNYGTFYPKTDIKRSEVAAIINRVANEDNRLMFTPAKPEASIPSYYTAEQKKAVQEIRIVYSKSSATYQAIKGAYAGEELVAFEKDYDQMLNDPYSSPELSEYFDIYIKSGDIRSLTSDCLAWLSNGGDDGTVNSKSY
jgi:hypothetical protein